jgi:hypothetical protein
MFSFFRKKTPKSPLTEEEEAWVNKHLSLIDQKLFKLSSKALILPNGDYFPFELHQEEEDAHLILNQIAQLINEKVDEVELEFYSEQRLDLGGGMKTQKDSTKGTAGTYQFFSNIISIEVGQLEHSEKLVATMIHELCHFLMHNKYSRFRWGEDEELITDLLAVAYGFGIFMGNAKYNFQQFQEGLTQGWSWSTQGYLKLPMIAHAMAIIELGKGNAALRPKWFQYLNPSFKQAYRKSMKYLLSIDDKKPLSIVR